MGIVVKDSIDVTPAPEGIHKVVCCDVVDGIVRDTKYGQKEKVQIRWECEDINPETKKPYMIVQEYTPSLDKKANLRGDLEAWRGKKFTDEELNGFDLEKLIGANGQIQIIHNKAENGRTYANVSAILPLPKEAQRLTVSKDYVRAKDRKKTSNQAKPSNEAESEF